MIIVVREAVPDDEEIFYRFNSALSERDLPREGFSQAFRVNLAHSNNLYIVAEADGEAIGMGSCHVQWLLHHAAPIAEIQELYVLPGFRSQGVGEILIKRLIGFAGSKNAEQVELSTNKKRVDAQRFYSREGFVNHHLKWTKPVSDE